MMPVISSCFKWLKHGPLRNWLEDYPLERSIREISDKVFKAVVRGERCIQNNFIRERNVTGKREVLYLVKEL